MAPCAIPSLPASAKEALAKVSELAKQVHLEARSADQHGDGPKVIPVWAIVVGVFGGIAVAILLACAFIWGRRVCSLQRSGKYSKGAKKGTRPKVLRRKVTDSLVNQAALLQASPASLYESNHPKRSVDSATTLAALLASHTPSPSSSLKSSRDGQIVDQALASIGSKGTLSESEKTLVIQGPKPLLKRGLTKKEERKSELISPAPVFKPKSDVRASVASQASRSPKTRVRMVTRMPEHWYRASLLTATTCPSVYSDHGPEPIGVAYGGEDYDNFSIIEEDEHTQSGTRHAAY